MNRSLGTLIAIGIVLILGTSATILFFPRESNGGTFDAFAQCLAEKKITMYGADWCPHCENEKKPSAIHFDLSRMWSARKILIVASRPASKDIRH